MQTESLLQSVHAMRLENRKDSAVTIRFHHVLSTHVYACLCKSALDWRMAEQNSGRGVDASNYLPPYTRSMAAELGHTPMRTGAKKTHVIYSRQSSHHGSSLPWPLTLKYPQKAFITSGCGDLAFFLLRFQITPNNPHYQYHSAQHRRPWIIAGATPKNGRKLHPAHHGRPRLRRGRAYASSCQHGAANSHL